MKIIELLKLRFGEQTLQQCDIMIKDIANSKRMNKLIHDENKGEEFEAIQSMIISHLFWPSFRNDSLILPPAIVELFDKFEEGYQNIKRDRKLEWIPFLGVVEIETELNGEQRSFSVNPLQATILYHFQDKSKRYLCCSFCFLFLINVIKGTWTLAELHEVMGISVNELKRRIMFWVGNGILQQEASDTFRVRQQNDGEIVDVTADIEDENVESSLTSAEAEKESMWFLCFNFINACLTNQGPMSIEKIHFMLSNLMREDYRATQAELRTFLESKIKEDLIEKEDNLYKSKE